MRHALAVIALTLLIVAGTVLPAGAAFHLTVIDEVMTSYQNSPSVQFVEMRMLAPAQSAVTNAVLAAFDATGTFAGDILVVPSNLSKSGTGTRWLVATSSFQGAAGIAPDFIMPAGILPTGGGMVCYGGGGSVFPLDPTTWDRTDFSNYIDCVAYGTYAGPRNALIGAPTTLSGDGHSLQRVGSTHNNSKDFACADPATPQNDSGDMAMLAASIPCASAPTPTSTPLSPTLTPTPVGGTPPPSHPCTGDCNGDGIVMVNEIVVAVNIALGSADIGTCPAFGGAPAVEISDLVAAVNSALNGCPPAPA